MTAAEVGPFEGDGLGVEGAWLLTPGIRTDRRFTRTHSTVSESVEDEVWWMSSDE